MQKKEQRESAMHTMQMMQLQLQIEQQKAETQKAAMCQNDQGEILSYLISQGHEQSAPRPDWKQRNKCPDCEVRIAMHPKGSYIPQ